MAFMAVCGTAEAGLLDDDNDLGQTIQAMRSAIGAHPRVLRIEVDPKFVTIEAQDPNNHNHINRWRCADRLFGFIPFHWVMGPEAVEPQLLNPDLEANLFDLDGISFFSDDQSNGGNPATFDLSSDGVSRAAITFSFNAQGPRFGVAELVSLNEQKIAALEADAIKRLSGNKQVYLESVSIGAHLIVRRAGARAIEVRVRDIPEDSATAEYGWIVYDFDGRPLDSAKGW